MPGVPEELVTAALTVTLFAYFWATWDTFVERMTEILTFPPQFYTMSFWSAHCFVIKGARSSANV